MKLINKLLGISKEELMMSKPRILSVDLGYSSIKVASYNADGVLQLDKYISACAKIDNPLDPGEDDTIFPFLDSYYILGPAALKVPQSYLLPLTTIEELLEVYPVWIAWLIRKYGGVENITAVGLGLSMAWSGYSETLIQKLYDTLMITKSGFFYCMPQGLSCKKIYQDYGLDLREDSKRNDYKMKNYLIADGGYNSVDVCNVLNGKAAAGAAIGIPNTGLINVSRRIVEYLQDNYNLNISLKEAQTIVDTKGLFQKRGKKYDISEAVDSCLVDYLEMILNMIESRFGDSLDQIEGILVAGGLSYFFKYYLEEKKDPRVIELVEKHFPISFIHMPVTDCEYMNAIAYLKILEEKL